MSDSELEVLKKDAERYRYLKSQAKFNPYSDWFDIWIETYDPVSDTDYRNSFDDAVDAEMRREKHEREPGA